MVDYETACIALDSVYNLETLRNYLNKKAGYRNLEGTLKNHFGN